MTLSINPLQQGFTHQPKIQFGKLYKNGQDYGGIFVNPEPVSHGGLGKVGQELPAVFEKELGVPLLNVFPVLKPLVGELKQAKVLTTVKVNDWENKPRSFDIVELPKTKDGVRRIGVANQELFGANDTLYSSIYSAATTLPAGTKDTRNYIEDGGFKAYAMFNKAVATLMNDHQEKLGQPLKFVVANDWMASSFISQLSDKQKAGLKKLFFFHNQYDHPRPKKVMEALGFKLPESFKEKKYVSSIGLGIEDADGVIINRNYFDHLTQTALAKGQGYLDKLKAIKDKVVDMHHGILETENPRSTSALKDKGFVLLSKDVNAETVAQFKATNKKALQKELGLKEDPNAVILNWMARFDPQQKGFGMVSESMKAALDKHPNLQLVICGMDATPKIKKDLDAVTADSKYKGRIFYSTKRIDTNQRLQIMAGSDYLMMPSLYEPFGLGQLEAMKMATIPIVNDVDGLKSTTSDPLVNRGDKEKAWEYGQNAIKMKPFESAGYMRGYDKINNPKDLSEQDEAILDAAKQYSSEGSAASKALKTLADDVQEKKVIGEADKNAVQGANQSFQEAVTRAVELAKDKDSLQKVRLNAIKYVDTEHTWPAIAKRFYQPILGKLLPGLQLS